MKLPTIMPIGPSFKTTTSSTVAQMVIKTLLTLAIAYEVERCSARKIEACCS